jgi:hypothetical protein
VKKQIAAAAGALLLLDSPPAAQYHSLPVESKIASRAAPAHVKAPAPASPSSCYPSLVDDCAASSRKPPQAAHEQHDMPAAALVARKSTFATQPPPPQPASAAATNSNIKRLTAHFSNTNLKPVVGCARSTAIPAFSSANPTANHRHSIHTSSLTSILPFLRLLLVEMVELFLVYRGSKIVFVRTDFKRIYSTVSWDSREQVMLLPYLGA